MRCPLLKKICYFLSLFFCWERFPHYQGTGHATKKITFWQHALRVRVISELPSFINTMVDTCFCI